MKRRWSRLGNNVEHYKKRTGRNKKSGSILRSWVGTVLIIAGLSLALYPFLSNVYFRHFSPAAVEENRASLRDSAPEEVPYLLPSGENGEGTLGTLELEEDDPLEKEPDMLEPEEGLLEIPALDIRVQVGYGVEGVDLQEGPGFYPDSGYPDTGNVSIAGHRTTYGAWFRHLDLLEEGDQILLFYSGRIYLYEVDRVFAVHDRDWSVIDPAPEPALTLTTCHPPGQDVERLVVRAYLVEMGEGRPLNQSISAEQ